MHRIFPCTDRSLNSFNLKTTSVWKDVAGLFLGCNTFPISILPASFLLHVYGKKYLLILSDLSKGSALHLVPHSSTLDNLLSLQPIWKSLYLEPYNRYFHCRKEISDQHSILNSGQEEIDDCTVWVCHLDISIFMGWFSSICHFLGSASQTRLGHDTQVYWPFQSSFCFQLSGKGASSRLHPNGDNLEKSGQNLSAFVHLWLR